MLSGKSTIKIDNKEIDLKEGSIIKVATGVARAVKSLNEPIIYICIQVKENSLLNYTLADTEML